MGKLALDHDELISKKATGREKLILLWVLVIIGLLVMAPSVFKRAFQSSGLKRRVRRLEKERSAKDAAQSEAAIAAADANAASAEKPAGMPGGSSQGNASGK